MVTWAESVHRLVPDEPWWDRETTLVVVDEGLLVEAGRPTGREILRQAAGHSDERVRRLVTALDSHLRDTLGLALGPVSSCEPRQIFAALADEEDPSAWIFGVRSGRPSRPAEAETARSQAISALFLVYHSLLAGSYDADVFSDEDAYAWEEELPAGAKEFCGALAPRTCIVTVNHDDLLERALFAAGRKWAYGVPVHFHGPMVDYEYAPREATIRQYYREGNVFYLVRPSFDDLPSQDFLYWARGDWRPPLNLVRVDPRETLRQMHELPHPLPWWGALGDQLVLLQPPAQLPAEVVLCKVSGSLRWVQCLSCWRTYSVSYWAAHPLGRFLGDFEIPDDGDLAFKCWNSECPEGLLTKVVAPTAKWRLLHRILRKQWVTAQRAAKGAHTLVLIGAALAEHDGALRDLVTCAVRSAATVAVVDHDRTASERASQFLGRPVRHFSSLAELADAGILAKT